MHGSTGTQSTRATSLCEAHNICGVHDYVLFTSTSGDGSGQRRQANAAGAPSPQCGPSASRIRSWLTSHGHATCVTIMTDPMIMSWARPSGHADARRTPVSLTGRAGRATAAPCRVWAPSRSPAREHARGTGHGDRTRTPVARAGPRTPGAKRAGRRRVARTGYRKAVPW